MSIGWMTEERREEACDRCGSQVTSLKHRIFKDGKITNWWEKPMHTAPCGLPCMGGGLAPKVLRSKQFHRSASDCPRCKPCQTS